MNETEQDATLLLTKSQAQTILSEMRRVMMNAVDPAKRDELCIICNRVAKLVHGADARVLVNGMVMVGAKAK